MPAVEEAITYYGWDPQQRNSKKIQICMDAVILVFVPTILLT